MKIDSSNKRISSFIAGILIVFVAFVFIAIASGVVGNHLYIQNRMDARERESNLLEVSSDLSGDIGNKDFVPVAQICPGGTWDTEQGSITVVDEDLADLFVFPLCFDPAVDTLSLLDDWYRIYRVYGGYVPCATGTQAFDLYQKGQIVTAPGYYVGWSIDWHMLTQEELEEYEWYDITDDCCAVEFWIATINVDCQNPGCLDSNQWPTVPVDCIPDFDPTTTIPLKDVVAELTSTWTGCGQPDQCFELILVQILRIPNSRINISSPVVMAIIIRNTFKIAG
jgi:hypothetical protein